MDNTCSLALLLSCPLKSLPCSSLQQPLLALSQLTSKSDVVWRAYREQCSMSNWCKVLNFTHAIPFSLFSNGKKSVFSCNCNQKLIIRPCKPESMKVLTSYWVLMVNGGQNRTCVCWWNMPWLTGWINLQLAVSSVRFLLLSASANGNEADTYLFWKLQPTWILWRELHWLLHAIIWRS